MTIEQGIPVPPMPKNDFSPLGRLQVGESVFFPDISTTNMSSPILHWSHRTGYGFTRKTMDGGVRVWRTA
jgi:hypothetical protein